jgi:hypothetical protein
MLYANITCSMSNQQSFGVSYYVSWIGHETRDTTRSINKVCHIIAAIWPCYETWPGGRRVRPYSSSLTSSENSFRRVGILFRTEIVLIFHPVIVGDEVLL